MSGWRLEVADPVGELHLPDLHRLPLNPRETVAHRRRLLQPRSLGERLHPIGDRATEAGLERTVADRAVLDRVMEHRAEHRQGGLGARRLELGGGHLAEDLTQVEEIGEPSARILLAAVRLRRKLKPALKQRAEESLLLCFDCGFGSVELLDILDV